MNIFVIVVALIIPEYLISGICYITDLKCGKDLSSFYQPLFYIAVLETLAILLFWVVNAF